MPNSFSVWELLIAVALAIFYFFVPSSSHSPRSHWVRAIALIVSLALLALSQYLWATTGRGLLERVTCSILPGGSSCLPSPAPSASNAKTDSSLPPTGQTEPASRPGRSSAPPVSRPALPPAPTGREASSPQPTTRTKPVSPPERQSVPPASTQAPQPQLPEGASPSENHGTRYVALTDGIAKDIWSTSVYSYAPGGGGPGGGLENDKLRVGGWGDEYVALLQFDLPDAPCTSKVTLELYNNNDSHAPTPLYLHVITAPWNWRRGDRLWWRDLPSSTSLDNRIVPAPGLNAWTSIDITELFRKWCTKELPNYGLMLRPVENNNNYDTFYSTRGPDDLRPRLIVAD